MSHTPPLTAQDAYRLKLHILAREAGGVAKLAALVGKSAAQMSQWINGSKDSRTGKPRSLRPESLRAIELALGKPHGWLDTAQFDFIKPRSEGGEWSLDNLQLISPTENRLLGEKLPPGAKPVAIAASGDPAFYHIQRVQLRLRAGVTGFQTVPDIYDGGTVSVAKNWVDRKGFDPSTLIALAVAGDSMEPNLYEGDVVIVNTADTTMKDGAVFAFNYDGESVIKRLVRERGDWWLFSDNPDQARYRPKGCRDGECCIIGRVVKRETDHI